MGSTKKNKIVRTRCKSKNNVHFSEHNRHNTNDAMTESDQFEAACGLVAFVYPFKKLVALFFGIGSGILTEIEIKLRRIKTVYL